MSARAGKGRGSALLGGADRVRVRADVRARRRLSSRRGEPQGRGDERAVLARRAALDEFGSGDQAVAECHLFDDIGVVARPAEPLIDDVDEADVVAAVEPGVHQIGPIDVEDHESCGSGRGVAAVSCGDHGKGVLRGALPAGQRIG